MKKTLCFALILMLLCVFALSACDNADTPPNNDNGRQTTDENGDNNSPENPTVCQHTFGEWDTVKQATCKEEGKRTRTCNKCSETEEESIQKSETHTTVIDEAVPATCKDTGLTDGSHCSVCNKVFVAQTVVPKTEDHTTVTDKAVSATCKNTGLTEGSHCSVCDKVFIRQIEVPITSNHSFISNQCSLCNLKVIEHGNVDGSISGGNNKVKYYVTGDIENYRNFEIVIYGNGETADVTVKGRYSDVINVDISDIEVYVHRQSIIHSMVEFEDHSVIAQLGIPDMKLPIVYALRYPERDVAVNERLNLLDIGTLTFDKPDVSTFECLSLAYKALNEGGTMPTVMNAANEIAVSKFLKDEIGFLDISEIIKATMNAHKNIKNIDINDVLCADKWAREYSSELNF